jgi:hypothetical protein
MTTRTKLNQKVIWLMCLTLLSCFLIAGLAGCGSSHTPGVTRLPASADLPANYTEYTDTGFGFRISFPEYWGTMSIVRSLLETARESIPKVNAGQSISPLVVLSVCPKSLIGTDSHHLPWLSITIRNASPKTASVAEAIAAHTAYMQGLMGEYDELSSNVTAIDGLDAMLLEYRHDASTGDTYTLMLITVRNGYIWKIQATSEPDKYEVWEADFHTILQSFSFLE